MILFVSYVVVAFSVLVQGLIVGPSSAGSLAASPRRRLPIAARSTDACEAPWIDRRTQPRRAMMGTCEGERCAW